MSGVLPKFILKVIYHPNVQIRHLFCSTVSLCLTIFKIFLNFAVLFSHFLDSSGMLVSKARPVGKWTESHSGKLMCFTNKHFFFIISRYFVLTVILNIGNNFFVFHFFFFFFVNTLTLFVKLNGWLFFPLKIKK